MKNQDLVLYIEWCVENGWYGERYRYILKLDELITSKSKLNKYKSPMRKFMKNELKENPHSPIYRNDDSFLLDIKERAELKEYIYTGAGPSFSWKHLEVTLEDLKPFIKTPEEKEARRLEIIEEKKEKARYNRMRKYSIKRRR